MLLHDIQSRNQHASLLDTLPPRQQLRSAGLVHLRTLVTKVPLRLEAPRVDAARPLRHALDVFEHLRVDLGRAERWEARAVDGQELGGGVDVLAGDPADRAVDVDGELGHEEVDEVVRVAASTLDAE